MDRQRLWCRPKILRAKLFDLLSATGLYVGLIAENFDTNAYRIPPEMAHAFEALAKEIERIVSGVSANVIPQHNEA